MRRRRKAPFMRQFAARTLERARRACVCRGLEPQCAAASLWMRRDDGCVGQGRQPVPALRPEALVWLCSLHERCRARHARTRHHPYVRRTIRYRHSLERQRRQAPRRRLHPASCRKDLPRYDSSEPTICELRGREPPRRRPVNLNASRVPDIGNVDVANVVHVTRVGWSIDFSGRERKPNFEARRRRQHIARRRRHRESRQGPCVGRVWLSGSRNPAPALVDKGPPAVMRCGKAPRRSIHPGPAQGSTRIQRPSL